MTFPQEILVGPYSNRWRRWGQKVRPDMYRDGMRAFATVRVSKEHLAYLHDRLPSRTSLKEVSTMSGGFEDGKGTKLCWRMITSR